MMCALRLAESGVRGVAVLEKNERLGRKLSATGNGQGNVTNEDMASRHYFSSTGSAENVLKRSENLIYCSICRNSAVYSVRTKSGGYIPPRARLLR